jgi:hypothetical protein
VEVLERILECLLRVKGIHDAFALEEADKFALLDIEIGAEKKAFMGFGKTYNSGIREVLRCPIIVFAITNMDFEWGCQAHMVLKKGDDIVGEEVRDPSRIKELEGLENVSFLHRNFVIYRDRVDFPKDIINKKCFFELPALTAEESLIGVDVCGEYVFCFPSTPGDVFLKNKYFGGLDELGTGTVLFGFKGYR